MKRHRLLSPLTILVIVGFLGVLGCGVLPVPGAGIEIELWSSEEIVAPGACTVLHWGVQGAEDYPIFLNGQEVAASDEEMVCLQQTTTFKLVVGAPGGPHQESVTVHVSGSAEAEPMTSPVGPLLATPVPSATPTSPPPGATQAPPTATRVPPTATPPPPASSEAPRIAYFHANGQGGSITVNPGTTVTLSWEWERVAEGYLDPGNIALACPAMPCSYQVTPGATTSYMLRAVNPSGTDTKAVTVNIGPGPSPTPTQLTGIIVPPTLAEIIIANGSSHTIASVHFRLAGASDWGPEMLGPGEFILPGSHKSFGVLPGTYDLTVASHRDTPAWQQGDVSISGQYVWTLGD